MQLNSPKKKPIFFVGALLFVFLLPVLILILQAGAGAWPWPRLFPEHWSLKNVGAALERQSGPLAQSILTSLGYSLATVVLSFILTISTAAAIVRGNLKNRTLVETLLMMPIMAPPIALSLGIHHIFIYAGLTDRWIGVVFILTIYSYPYMLRSLTSGFEAIGERYMLAAQNLGAGQIRTIFEIEVPLLIPSIVSGGSVVFLVAYSSYYLVFLIGGGSVAGYSGYLFPFLTSANRPMAAILSLLFLIIPLLLFVVMETTVIRWYRRRGIRT